MSSPTHPIEVRISIGANGHKEFKELLDDIYQQFVTCPVGQLVNGCSGGWSGAYSITTAVRDISAEDYRAELALWAGK